MWWCGTCTVAMVPFGCPCCCEGGPRWAWSGGGRSYSLQRPPGSRPTNLSSCSRTATEMSCDCSNELRHQLHAVTVCTWYLGEVEAALRFGLLFEFLPVVQQHCTLKAFSILSPHLYEELFCTYIFIHIKVTIYAHFNGILFVQCLAAIIITIRSWSKLF